MGSTFRARLQEADLTAEEFAEIVRVDPKTVQRWVAGRVPQRRHRAKIARALDTSPDLLWPGEAASLAAVPGQAAGAIGSGGDVIASWAAATDEGAPDPADFVLDDGPIDLLDSGWVLLGDDRLIAALVSAAGARSPVRVLVDSPRRELLPLVGVEHLELRVFDLSGGSGVVRGGDRMLVFLDLAGAGDQPRPLLELREASEAGLFARLVDHFDDVWEEADDPIASDEQLDSYLIDTPRLREYVGDGSAADPEPPDHPNPPAGDASDSAARPPSSPARRWPRRPT